MFSTVRHLIYATDNHFNDKKLNRLRRNNVVSEGVAHPRARSTKIYHSRNTPTNRFSVENNVGTLLMFSF